jgi:hypothetical protein
MRMRADQVREGHRLKGAVVTRVRAAAYAGVVRITVENADAPANAAMATGTFCYRSDDVLDVETTARPGPIPALKARSRSRSGRGDAPTRTYRVEYQAPAGDGHLIVRDDTSATPSLVVRAHDLLQMQGIDARIRRIVPIEADALASRRSARSGDL